MLKKDGTDEKAVYHKAIGMANVDVLLGAGP